MGNAFFDQAIILPLNGSALTSILPSQSRLFGKDRVWNEDQFTVKPAKVPVNSYNSWSVYNLSLPPISSFLRSDGIHPAFLMIFLPPVDRNRSKHPAAKANVVEPNRGHLIAKLFGR